MRPPQHSIEATPVYVLHDDPAWNTDRIEDEKAGLEDKTAHPVAAYLRGETRYDLAAPITWPGGENAASEYLGDDATRYQLRRLSVLEHARIQDSFTREVNTHGEQASSLETWVLAARLGIAAIDGPGLTFPLGARMTESTMRAVLEANGGIHALVSIGIAVWELSKPLSASEGKRSGS